METLNALRKLRSRGRLLTTIIRSLHQGAVRGNSILEKEYVRIPPIPLSVSQDRVSFIFRGWVANIVAKRRTELFTGASSEHRLCVFDSAKHAPTWHSRHHEPIIIARHLTQLGVPFDLEVWYQDDPNDESTLRRGWYYDEPNMYADQLIHPFPKRACVYVDIRDLERVSCLFSVFS